MKWYVVQCKHLAEARAAAALRLILGVEVYLPEVQSIERGRAMKKAFFPGYMFVCLNFQTVALSRLKSMPGIIGVLTFDNQPGAVADDVVEAIQARVAMWQQPRPAIEREGQPGGPARSGEEALAGFDDIFHGAANAKDRVRGLIAFLGQRSEATPALLQLQAGNTHRRLRRSRGHKRLIRPSKERGS